MTETNEQTILSRLFALIEGRKGKDPETSYTAQLLAGGVGKIAEKLGEEAIETVLAAVTGEREALIHESADLLYHLLVLLAARGIRPEDVFAELEKREGRSGIEEKRARKR